MDLLLGDTLNYNNHLKLIYSGIKQVHSDNIKS